jgi:hypothetical protein
MPRKDNLRDFKIEIPVELDQRLKNIFKRKGQKSVIARALLENYCSEVEARSKESCCACIHIDREPNGDTTPFCYVEGPYAIDISGRTNICESYRRLDEKS